VGTELKEDISTAEKLISVEVGLLKVPKKVTEYDIFLIIGRDTPCVLNPHSEANTKTLVTSNCQFLLLNVQTVLMNGATRSISS